MVLGAVGAAAGCGGGRDDEAAAAVADEVEVIPEGRDSAAVVEEEDWAVAVPEEESALQRAEQHFRRREMREAAGELRHASDRIFRLRQGVEDAGAGAGADRAVAELTRLAGQLEGGTAVPEAEMRGALARAHLALAAEHRALAMQRRAVLADERRADRARDRENAAFRELGAELAAAAGHLERGAARAGRGDDPEVRRIVQEARAVRERMDRGDEVAATEVQGVLDAMGAASERLVAAVEAA
jgi:hypothetical protein